MIERAIGRHVLALAQGYPVVTVTGPRQSGKTTLVRMLFPAFDYVNLEIPDVRAEALRDPRGFLLRHAAPVILDEIQHAPMLLSYIQAEVDEVQRKGMYILTGSHQPELQAAITQSLAGRTGLAELLPLSIAEWKAAVPASRAMPRPAPMSGFGTFAISEQRFAPSVRAGDSCL